MTPPNTNLTPPDDLTEPLFSAAGRVQRAVEERVRQARSDLDAVRARLAVLDIEHRQLERERRGIQDAFEERAGPGLSWSTPTNEDEEAAELARARQRVARRIRADLTLNPTDTESSLRNARQALRTAVLYAERLDLVTRTLSSIADLPTTTRTTSLQRAAGPSAGPGAGAGTGSPPGERHARAFPPGASASIQRSLAQLRAAQARIEQALEEQAAEREAEREAAGSSASTASSEATARALDGHEPAPALDRQPTLLGSMARNLLSDTSTPFAQNQARRRRLSSLLAGTDTASPANPPPGLSSRSAGMGGGTGGAGTSPYAPFVPYSLREFIYSDAPDDPSEAPGPRALRRPVVGGGTLEGSAFRPVARGDEGRGLDSEGGSPGRSRRQRKYTLAVKLDANGDAVDEETSEEAEERRKGRRDLVGR